MLNNSLLQLTHFIHESFFESNLNSTYGLYEAFRRAKERSPHRYDLSENIKGRRRIRILSGMELFLGVVFTVSGGILLSLLGLFVTYHTGMIDLTFMGLPVVPLLSLLGGYGTFKVRLLRDTHRFNSNRFEFRDWEFETFRGKIIRILPTIFGYLPMMIGLSCLLFGFLQGIPLTGILESIMINAFVLGIGFQLASFRNRGFDGSPVPKFILDNHSCIDTDLNPGTYLRVSRLILNNFNYEGLFGRIGYPLHRLLWYLHFNGNTLSKILDINDRYYSHYLEMKDDCKDIPSTDPAASVIPISNEDSHSKEPWVSSEMLIFLDLNGKEDLDTLRNDPYMISVLLDMLESNWDIYHLQWNRNFVATCHDMSYKDLHPRSLQTLRYISRDGDINGSEFKVRLCLGTLLPYFGKDSLGSILGTFPLIGFTGGGLIGI